SGPKLGGEVSALVPGISANLCPHRVHRTSRPSRSSDTTADAPQAGFGQSILTDMGDASIVARPMQPGSPRSTGTPDLDRRRMAASMVVLASVPDLTIARPENQRASR